jgi:protein O-GlcNAc transferase
MIRYSVHGSFLFEGSFFHVAVGFISVWFCPAIPVVGVTPSPGQAQAASSARQTTSSSQAASLEARGAAAYQSGQFKEAEPLLEGAVRLNPGSARAHALLGLTLARRDELPDAVRNLEQAHEIEPANPDYAYDYAVLLLQARHFSPAATILESLRTESPESADVIVNLARAYAGAGDFAKLSVLVSGLSGAAYGNEAQLQALATILAEAKQMTEIEQLWQAAIRHDPSQPLPYAALAEFWTARDEAGRALPLLDAAPSPARTGLYYYARGQTLLGLQNYNAACSSFQEATRLSPGNEHAWIQLVRAYMLANRLPEAEAAVESAARAFPDVSEFQYQQGVIDYMLNRSAAAMKLLTEKLSTQTADDPRAVLLLAVLESQSGDYDGARRNFERSARLESGCNPLTSYFYGVTLLRMHRPQEAAAHLQTAVRCRPHFAQAEYRLGQALSDTGMLRNAQAAFEQAIHDEPALAEPYYALAQLRRRLGDEAGAQAALAQFKSVTQHVQDSDRDLFRSSP